MKKKKNETGVNTTAKVMAVAEEVKEKASEAKAEVKKEAKVIAAEVKEKAGEAAVAAAEAKEKAAKAAAEAKEKAEKAAAEAKGKAEKAAKTVKAAVCCPKVSVQSQMGGELTVEEIAARVAEKAAGKTVSHIYIKTEENKAYYVADGETGFVTLW